jgi:hypothetical protein
VTVVVHRLPERRRHGRDALIKEARDRQRRRRLRFALLVAAIVAAGLGYEMSLGAVFGGRSPALAERSIPNPCALVTNADVSAALGSKIAFRDVPDLGGRGRSCRWTGRSLSRSDYYEVRRMLLVLVSPSTRAQFERSSHQPGAVKVAGAGGVAFADRGPTRVVHVWRDGLTLLIQAVFVTNPIAAAAHVARIAVVRL